LKWHMESVHGGKKTWSKLITVYTVGWRITIQ
jgi:hypothetical protein